MDETTTQEMILMDEMTAILQENMELYAENERLYQLFKVMGENAYNNIEKSTSERDAEMIRLRLDSKLTLQEIADRYNVSRERVRQIVGNSGYVNMKSTRQKADVLANPDLTNDEAAEMFDVTASTISNYRTGTRHAIKPSRVGDGIEKENEFAQKMIDMGMDVILMPHRHPFDAMVNGWRVDFKYSKAGRTAPSLKNVNPCWQFNVKRGKRADCDFYFCVTRQNDVFIIPSSEVPDKMNSLIFNYPVSNNSKGKWQSYKNRYDLLQPKKG